MALQSTQLLIHSPLIATPYASAVALELILTALPNSTHQLLRIKSSIYTESILESTSHSLKISHPASTCSLSSFRLGTPIVYTLSPPLIVREGTFSDLGSRISTVRTRVFLNMQ